MDAEDNVVPVCQTRFGNDSDAPGNCFSACVASILECSLEDLPDEIAIIAQLKQEYASVWENWPPRFKWGKSWMRLWEQTQAIVRQRGLTMVEVKGPFPSEIPVDVYCIISGQSPRGLEHSCVGRGLKIIHDPHPSEAGVSEDDRSYIFFVCLDPASL